MSLPACCVLYKVPGIGRRLSRSYVKMPFVKSKKVGHETGDLHHKINPLFTKTHGDMGRLTIPAENDVPSFKPEPYPEPSAHWILAPGA